MKNTDTKRVRKPSIEARTKPAKHRGASRRPKTQEKAMRLVWKSWFIWPMLLIGISVACVMVARYRLIEWNYNTTFSLSREIKQIEVQGDFAFVDRHQLESVVSNYIQQRFFEVNIVELKSILEGHPWVDRVNVSRHWPDKIVVTVIEQQPIARWGDIGFLNQRGDVVQIDLVDQLTHLPRLSGDDRYAAEVMQQYLRISKLLWQSEMTLSEVQLDDTLAWVLTLSPDMQIYLGKDKVLEKLQTLLQIKQNQLAARFDKIKSIDMRYSRGFAVAWKINDEKHVASLK